MLPRVGQVALAGVVITAWMGLVEALLVCLSRDVPEPLLVLREAVLGYAVFGGLVGAVFGVFFEIIAPRRPWRRRVFYLLSLFLLILLFQLILHTHLHWSGGRLAPGSARSLKVTALMTLPAVVLIGVAWFLSRRSTPGEPRPPLGLRAGGLLLIVPALVALGPWVAASLTSPRRAVG